MIQSRLSDYAIMGIFGAVVAAGLWILALPVEPSPLADIPTYAPLFGPQVLWFPDSPTYMFWDDVHQLRPDILACYGERAEGVEVATCTGIVFPNPDTWTMVRSLCDSDVEIWVEDPERTTLVEGECKSGRGFMPGLIYEGPSWNVPGNCRRFDLDGDGDVDLRDYSGVMP